MPNHCSNDLRINGTKKNIEAFFAAVKGAEDKLIDAGKIIPYPKKYADLDDAAAKWEKENPGKWKGRPKDGYNQGGYEWCNKNWGTKWGLYDFSDVENFKQSAVVSFDTAWSPPVPIILAASKLFPTLTFTLRYYECGMGYKGVYKVKNGDVLADEYTEGYRGDRGG